MRVALAMAGILGVACAGQQVTDSDVDTASDTDTDTDTDTEHPLAVFTLPEQAETLTEHAATSTVCANCHSNADESTALRDTSGRPVGPYDLARASMMSLSARDPVYRTAVAVEAAAQPSLPVQAKCTPCHAPVAAMQVWASGEGTVDQGLLADEGELGNLARDGASCVACHRLEPEGLGQPDTWSGALQFTDEAVIYGPYAAPTVGPMRGFTGFTPTGGDHMRDATLCAGCHTLFTDSVDGDGVPTGHTLPEQTPYLEWQASDYNTARGLGTAQTCQACHLPWTDDDGESVKTSIARTPSGRDYPRLFEREPFGRHLLVGGNTAVLQMLRDHRLQLVPDIPDSALANAINATRLQLQQRTATLSATARVLDAELHADVIVRNLTGHKLPTGYPARRMWLQVRVLDANDDEVFAAGTTDGHGNIVDAEGQILPSERFGGPTEPHRSAVQFDTDVVSWQAVMGTADGLATESLLSATQYIRDDRLLPEGWRDPAASVRAIGVQGDPDFVGGQDGVHVQIPLSGEGPWTLELQLRYQSLTPRHLQALTSPQLPESRALAFLVGDGLPSEVIASSTTRVSAP